MKQWQIVKTVLYSLAGVAVLIFHERILDFVGAIVGSVILTYGLDVLIVSIIKKTYIGGDYFLFGGLVHLLIAVIIFMVSGDLVKICLVWAVWSIIREGKELSESIHRLTLKKPAIVNVIESVTVVYLSFSMILEPTLRHAHIHVVLLGIELILEVAFPFVNGLIDKFFYEKRRLKTAGNVEPSLLAEEKTDGEEKDESLSA